MLILLFSVYLGWLPSGGMNNGFASLILPSITLGAESMATITRTTRSSMLEVIRQDSVSYTHLILPAVPLEDIAVA